jgi:hypothetical protein
MTPGSLLSRKFRWEYILLCVLLELGGIGIRILLSGEAFVRYAPLNATELRSAYEMFEKTALPVKIGDAWGIFLGNYRALLILVLLPVTVSWCVMLVFSLNGRRTELSPEMVKPVLYLSMIFLGYNSFTRLYPRFEMYPFTVFAAHYVYHGIIEMGTYVVCAVWTLHNLDTMDDAMRLKPPLPRQQRVKTSLINCVFPLLFGLAFLALAAYIETQVTPYLILDSYLPYIGS